MCVLFFFVFLVGAVKSFETRFLKILALIKLN